MFRSLKDSPVRFVVLAIIGLLTVTSLLPLVQGDGGFIPLSIQDIFESSQNAIIGWDGETERMCLSVNIYAEEDTEGFHVVPFPSMPEVQLGDVKAFERYREKLGGFSDRYREWGKGMGDFNGYRGNASAPKVDIMFEDTIGEHDVTVVRVNDMSGFEDELFTIIVDMGISIDGYPAGLDQIIKNYTSRGFNYFSIDHYPIYRKEKTIEPLIYTFETDALVFPLEISSMLEGSSLVRLGLFTSPNIPIDLSSVKDMGPSAYANTRPWLVGGEDLYFIDDGLWSMFPEGAVSTYIQASIPLFMVRGDLKISRSQTIDWSRPCPFMTDDYPTHDFSMIDIEGTDRIVLYNREASLGHDSKVICINRTDGSTSWEISRRTGTIGRYDDRMSVVIFSEDHDEDGTGDLILCYFDIWGTVVERIDPITGDVIWSRRGSDILYPSELLTIHDGKGAPYLCLIGPEFICAMNPASGVPKASYRTIMRDIGGSNFGGRIDTGNIHILSLDGNGEGLLFHDGYRWIVWSPFHYFEDPYGLSGLSDDNVLWEGMFQFQGLTLQDGEEHILSLKWDDPHGELCYIDPLDGTIDVRTPREEWPEYRKAWGRMLFDLDDDGYDDIITIYRPSDPREIRIACFDPFTGARHWDQLLLTFDLSYSTENMMEIIDLDGDEDPELLVQFGTFDNIAQGQPFVFIIEPEDGRIVATWEDALLYPFRPDLNGNGIPEITIRQPGGEVCIVEMIGGLVLKIDYTGNFRIYQNDIEGHLFRIVDLGSDGKDDLILLQIDHGYSSQYLFSRDYPDGICIIEQYIEVGRYHPSLSGGVFNTVFTIGDVLQGFSIPLGEIPSDVREIEVQTITFTEERYIGRTYFEDDDDASDDDLMDPTDTDDDDVPDSLISDQQDAIDISPILTFSIMTFAMLITFIYVAHKWRKF